jgi:hypothetical protein
MATHAGRRASHYFSHVRMAKADRYSLASYRPSLYRWHRESDLSSWVMLSSM